jgi:hypothetical protein
MFGQFQSQLIQGKCGDSTRIFPDAELFQGQLTEFSPHCHFIAEAAKKNTHTA